MTVAKLPSQRPFRLAWYGRAFDLSGRYFTPRYPLEAVEDLCSFSWCGGIAVGRPCSFAVASASSSLSSSSSFCASASSSGASFLAAPPGPYAGAARSEASSRCGAVRWRPVGGRVGGAAVFVLGAGSFLTFGAGVATAEGEASSPEGLISSAVAGGGPASLLTLRSRCSPGWCATSRLGARRIRARQPGRVSTWQRPVWPHLSGHPSLPHTYSTSPSSSSFCSSPTVGML